MDPRIDFLIYLMHFIGIPYIWGGKAGSVGLDCSGFTQIALDFFQIDPAGEHSAADLYGILSATGRKVANTPDDVPRLGDLCFFGNATHIHHVGVAVNQFEMVEAAHGDETVTSVAIAQAKNARVMINNIARLLDLYAIVRPAGYPWGLEPTSQSPTESATPATSGDQANTPG